MYVKLSCVTLNDIVEGPWVDICLSIVFGENDDECVQQ